MKKTILTIALILSCSVLSFAQEKGFKVALLAETGSNFGKKTLFNPQDYNLNLGYMFPNRMYVGIPFTVSNELMKTNGLRTFDTNMRLGANIGYNVMKDGFNSFIVSGGFGGSIYADSRKSLYYDISGKWSVALPVTFVVGVGVRYYQSLDTHYKDFVTAYVSLGLMINFHKR